MIHFVKLELERVLPELRVEERGQPLRDGCVLGVVPLEDGAGDAVTSEDKQADSLTCAHQAGGRVVSVEDNETLLASDILRHMYSTIQRRWFETLTEGILDDHVGGAGLLRSAQDSGVAQRLTPAPE